MKFFSRLLAFAILSGVTATDSIAKSPVEKVVQLIEELQANLLRDAKVEQQIYDKYACWCENTAGAKAAGIVMLQSEVVQLTQDVLELKGQVAVLAKEISDTTTSIAENEETQKSSTAVRQKENGAWMTEKAELEEAINALERAITVLSGAGTKTGLLQGSGTASEAARKHAISSVLLSLPTRANLEPMQLAEIQSFASDFQPTAADASASYAPQSATVQGILKDMYDSFSADLEKITQEEATKQKDYEDLTAGLVKELGMMNGVVANKEEEKAAAEQELADTVQELDDTKKQMDADIQYFDELKTGCKAKHEEWVARKAAREEELKGIEEALKILTSDDARALFGKAIKPGMETSLLQIDSDSSDSSRMRAANKAYDALKAGAQRTHSLRLASLAATLRSMGAGHFDAVIEEIDKMMQELKDEGAEDIKQRDWCKDEYQKNSEEKKQLKWLIKNNDAMITKLENTIEKLIGEIKKTVEEIEVTEDQIKKMEDERKAEHKEFQTAKKDDEMAIELLQKTVEVLSSYHKKHKTGMGPIQGSMKLLQDPEFKRSRWEAPEAKFSDTGSRKNESKGIISIITMLIEDLQSEVSNGVKDEVSAQADFEKSVATAKKLIEDLTVKKENLEEDKAKMEQKKADEEETKATNQESLKINEEYLQGIKPDCDWMLNSFEERVAKRKAEMDGLTTAKEYLTGAAPPAMVQIGTSFDDTKLERIGFESLRR